MKLTPMKAIRVKCIDCCCGQKNEVRLCPIIGCSLYPYRMGHNPARAGKGHFAQKQPIQMGHSGDGDAAMGTDTPKDADAAKPIASPTIF